MPDTPSMIERVARYLCANLSNLGPDDPIPVRRGFQVYVAADPPADGTMPAWKGWVRIARELLNEMRDPTDMMITAHNEAIDCHDDMKRQAIVDWQSMIDAALEDGR